jgi:hypothetical protein
MQAADVISKRRSSAWQCRRTGSLPRAAMLDYDDYCTFPNDGKRYEIIEGDLHVSPSPLTIHQRISMLLAARLYVFRRPGRARFFRPPVTVKRALTSSLLPGFSLDVRTLWR